MVIRYTWILIIICIGVAGCAVSRSSSGSFSFIQMSDTQFGMFNEDKSFEKESAHFEQAVAEANKLKPTFVIVTGDLVNKPFDSAQIREYKRIAAKLNPAIKLYNVPGNHDIGNIPSEADIHAYNLIFGPDYYTFRQGRMLGIVMNSMLLHSPHNALQKADAQETWLRSVLENTKKDKWQHIVIFLHHPFFLEQPAEADGYFNIPLDTRKKYLDLFLKYGIRYIFAGHYHRNAYGQPADIQMVTTGPVGKPLGKDPSGFRLVKVTPEAISHRYYALDSLH